MPILGQRSRRNLETCRHELISLAGMAIQITDFSIIEGFRSEEKQNEYFNSGKSKVHWPDSKHNKTPSEAFDAVPYVNGNISWNKYHCIYNAGIFIACAYFLDIVLRWGGNWDMDFEVMTDQSFQDLVHFEIIL